MSVTPPPPGEESDFTRRFDPPADSWEIERHETINILGKKERTMTSMIGRREMIAGAAAMAAAGSGTAAAGEAPRRKVIAINGSPRLGMTTSAALAICLEAAKAHTPSLDTELIELAGYQIPAQLAAGVPLREGETDEFPLVAEKLGAPEVAAIIVGSPVYFGNMSALCKAFLDRLAVFRADGFKLRNMAAGVLAVGGARNGGQELTIRSIQTALLCQDMVLVGDGMPSSRIGATFWSDGGSIEGDGFGAQTAENLGRRVAELAAMLHS